MEGYGALMDLPLNGSSVRVIRTVCPVPVANGASTEFQDPSLLLGFNKSTLSERAPGSEGRALAGGTQGGPRAPERPRRANPKGLRGQAVTGSMCGILGGSAADLAKWTGLGSDLPRSHIS